MTTSWGLHVARVNGSRAVCAGAGVGAQARRSNSRTHVRVRVLSGPSRWGISLRALHTLHAHTCAHLGHTHPEASHWCTHRPKPHATHWHRHHAIATHPSSAASHTQASATHTSHHAASVLKATICLYPSHALKTSRWRALEASAHRLLIASSVVACTAIVVAATTITSITTP